MGKLTVNRDVTREECPWLDEDVKAGEEVFRYEGFTYGCIGPKGTAVSRDPSLGPFFELPREALSKAKEADGDQPS